MGRMKDLYLEREITYLHNLNELPSGYYHLDIFNDLVVSDEDIWEIYDISNPKIQEPLYVALHIDFKREQYPLPVSFWITKDRKIKRVSE